jgi:hypothetical protein
VHQGKLPGVGEELLGLDREQMEIPDRIYGLGIAIDVHAGCVSGRHERDGFAFFPGAVGEPRPQPCQLFDELGAVIPENQFSQAWASASEAASLPISGPSDAISACWTRTPAVRTKSVNVST